MNIERNVRAIQVDTVAAAVHDFLRAADEHGDPRLPRRVRRLRRAVQHLLELWPAPLGAESQHTRATHRHAADARAAERHARATRVAAGKRLAQLAA